jgi:alpha-ketoglutarate-dependent taurine dioxygenase
MKLEGDLPLVIEPDGERSTESLVRWLAAERAAVADHLRAHGALLFRGFDVGDPAAFERVARAVTPELAREYLGTSPRNALTDYVFSASELPPWYPIPQHCEMTFLARPPRRLFFWCGVAPVSAGGETPLVDFRKVQAALDPAVRQRFVDGGIRIVRNYGGPGGGGRLNPFQLKRWDEMFLTTDRALVEQKCRDEGFAATWLPGGRLRLVSEQPALRAHPETGEAVWHNHVQVFHVGSGAAEYRRIFRDRRDLRSFAVWQLARALELVERRKGSDARAMHCTYGDGREIPDADLEHLRDVIWRHMVRFRWRAGDVVAIDNYAVSHGRMPYRGPRQIAVAWA